MAQSSILLLDEDDWDVFSSLRELERMRRKSPHLQRFLRDVTDALQIQVAALGPLERQALGCPRGARFETLLDLASACGGAEGGGGALHSVFACICALGEMMVCRHVAERRWSAQDKTYVLALGAGALFAAAVAVARDVADLCELGRQVVAVTLRLSVELRLRSVRIEPTPQSWSRSVVDGRVGDDVARLCADHSTLFPLRRVYVSAQAHGWTTVSGPPSALSTVLASTPCLAAAPPTRSALSALHAPHLPPLDLEAVVGASPLLQRPVIAAIHDVSTPGWSPYRARCLGDLLKEMSHRISQEPVRIARIPCDIIASLATPDACNLIVLLGSVSRTNCIAQELKDRECHAEVLEDAGAIPAQQGLRCGSDSIAVVGMAGRFPGSESVEGFWQSLWAGTEFHQKVPEDRFDLAAWHHAAGGESPLPYGCFLERPGLFDNHFFNVSPREALQMDPNQRLLLTVSYEALQRAGYSPNATNSTDERRIATFFGQTTDDWREVSNARGIDIYYVPGLLRSFAPGRLNYHYKWEGPSYSVDSTCASSASAISLACTALLGRECDMALAGGVNSLSSPAMFAGLKAGGFLSPTGPCKTFRRDADGYCRAEGIGVVVLKRLEDAMLDNDNILAVIRSHARNHSAHASSITHPDAGAQSKLYHKVLQNADLHPNQIAYVEMHGTGTQAGDLTEMQAVVSSLCKERSESHPLVVGAVKANVGHAEAAAGVISMIKAIMVLRTGRIPPQPGMPLDLNPRLPPSVGRTVRIADGNMSFNGDGRPGESRKLLLNNFDASGGNVCFVIEEAPSTRSRPPDNRSHHSVIVSARTISSLKKNIKQIAGYLMSFPSTRLPDVAYTTTARGMHERVRIAYVAASRAALLEQLCEETPRSVHESLPVTPPNVAFLCTGMSVQYAGMGAELYQTNCRFRHTISSMEGLCVSQGLPKFASLITDTGSSLDSSTPTQVQLALVAVEIALADLWRSWGIQPSFVIGHSLGEYAALCIAGVLSVGDTMALVGFRASLMEEKLSCSTHAMLAVSASPRDVIQRLSDKHIDGCTVSCFNAPCSTVVAGPVEQIKKLQQTFRDQHMRTAVLKVPYAFHSPQLDPIIAAFTDRARSANFNKPRIPVVSALLAKVIRDDGIFDVNYLVRQTQEPVRFTNALETCAAEGLANSRTVWLEVGPDRVCLEFVRATLQASTLLPTIRAKEPNWKTIAAAVSSMYMTHIPVDWSEYHREYEGCLSLIELPTYQFHENNFWTPYRRDIVKSADTASLAISAHVSKLSTSLHWVRDEAVKENGKSFEFSSDLADADLHAAIQGHIIGDAAVCPGSVFCDIALTAAGYIHAKTWPGRRLSMELQNMTLEQAIVLPEATTKVNNIVVTGSMMRDAEDRIELAFTHSFKSHSTVTGHCSVILDDVDHCWQEFTTPSFYIRARMDSVIAAVAESSGHHLHKGMVYKIFTNVVKYSASFQAIDEIFWNEKSGEAVAAVSFQKNPGMYCAQYSPYWLDVMLHLPGFMLNANTTSSGDVVWICDGFKRMRFPSALATHKSYRCYVRKQDDGTQGLSNSEVYLFDGEELVGMCIGIRFKRLPRAMLPRILRQHDSGDTAGLTGQMNNPRPPPVHMSQQVSKRPPQMSKNALSTARVHAVDPENQHRMADLLIKVVAEETGVALNEIRSTTEFTSLGVDSLLSISIVDRVRKFTGVQLGANFFAENSTVSDARAALKHHALADLQIDSSFRAFSKSEQLLTSATSAVVDAYDERGTSPHPEGSPTPPEVESTSDDSSVPEPDGDMESTRYTSNAVLVHGNADLHQRPLFLIADGSGSATAYLKLPRFSSNMPMYALESPFLHCPQQYCYTVEETARMYISTMRGIQRYGPYAIAGWSAGGVHAYEICRQLLAMGEIVHRLVILDMHIPRPMPRGHEVTPSFIEKIGVAAGIHRMANRMTPDAVRSIKEHLLHTIRSLSSYTSQPMLPPQVPAKTTIIWARKSLSEVFGEDDLKEAKNAGLMQEVEGNVMQDPEMGLAAWFFSRRHHFGANGWDELVGGSVICYDVDADHFSMMAEPAVHTIGRLLEQAVG